MLAAALLLGACTPAPPTAVRNVILICFDTVRFDTFWFPELAGHPDALSPWNQRATVWTHALSPGPWTVPSVASVLTGYYPSQHGAGLFDETVANLSEGVPSKIPDTIPTVTELMMEAGIRTVGYSSHPWFQSGYGFKRGFRRFSLIRGAEQLLAKADDWLNQRPKAPFFLYLHFMDAHDRHVRPRQLKELQAEFDPAVVKAIIENAPHGVCDNLKNVMCRRYQVYAFTVLDLRERLAGFLDDLERRGLLADTAVMVYSDHGEEFHDHLAESVDLDVDPRGFHGFGHGQSLYQELIHVPLLAWLPETAGIVDTPVSLVDITPTLLGWTGVEVPATVTGVPLDTGAQARTLTPSALTGPWPDRERVIYASGIAYGPEQFAIVQGGWKYVWHENSRKEQLFDLAADPRETDPLENDSVAATLDAQLDEYLGWYSERDFVAPELSSEQLDRLKGIGYLQGVSTPDDDEPGSEDEETDSIAPAKAVGHE